jgi:pimeloyl-ACP methyl ester carboxylesterase
VEERGFFLNRGGRRLFYCRHGAGTPGPGWLFCNPFLEEKTFTHSLYVALARRLAAGGQTVLRFDYEGDGDSEGDLSGLGLEDWVTDIEDAAAFASDHHGLRAPALFGVRLGGSLACLAAGRVNAARVLAWEPVAHGETYLQDCLMLNLTTQLATYKKVVEDRKALLARMAAGQTVNVAGHEIGDGMAKSLAHLKLGSAVAALTCPVHVVAVVKASGASPGRDLQALAVNPNVMLAAQHVPPFWYEPKFLDSQQAALVEVSGPAFAHGAVN